MTNLNVSDKIETGSVVLCSSVSNKDAVETPHMAFVVIGVGREQYHTISVEDVDDYNSGNQVTVFPWEFAVPTGRKAPVVERAFLEIPCQQFDHLWDEEEEDRDFCLVGEREAYRVYIAGVEDILHIFREINDY